MQSLPVLLFLFSLSYSVLAQHNGTCSGDVLAGQTWAGANYAGNTSLAFETADRFVYAVREGARVLVSARGRFTIRKAAERAGDRFRSNCQIQFEPAEMPVTPTADDRRRLQSNGLLDGGKQTFWIEKKAPAWEPAPFLELLEISIWESDPGSVRNFTLQQRR